VVDQLGRTARGGGVFAVRSLVAFESRGDANGFSDDSAGRTGIKMSDEATSVSPAGWERGGLRPAMPGSSAAVLARMSPWPFWMTSG